MAVKGKGKGDGDNNHAGTQLMGQCVTPVLPHTAHSVCAALDLSLLCKNPHILLLLKVQGAY